MPTVLVTGANGQLGQELQALQTDFPQLSFTFAGRDTIDLTNAEGMHAYFAAHSFDYCVNCAAYTAVDKAESDQELCRQVNTTAVKTLAELCRDHNCKLIHISSDYVYHNQLNRPLKEDDPTEPKGIYAQTKLEGEQLALQANPNCLILRTSWVYSTFGHNFVKTMIRLGTDRDRLTIVSDQIGAPTYARDIARLLLQLIAEQPADKLTGIYNFSNEGVCSWYDFAKAIFKLKNINCNVSPIPSSDYPTPAPRPHYSVMDKHKLKTTFGVEIAHWEDALKACLDSGIR